MSMLSVRDVFCEPVSPSFVFLAQKIYRHVTYSMYTPKNHPLLIKFATVHSFKTIFRSQAYRFSASFCLV